MTGVDFSRNASVYDQRHGAFASETTIARLAELAGLPASARALDIGAGTGRVAIPLARAGHRVTAIDLSRTMLAGLAHKAPPVRLQPLVGDATRLAFAPVSFDAVVVARLLYLVPDWPRLLEEALRVLRPGGVLLHEWGNGREGDDWVQVREHARELFVAAGVSEPFHPGARTSAEVDRHLEGLGASRIGETTAPQDAPLTMRTFLGQIERDETSYTWKLPTDVRKRCVADLIEWASARFDLDRPIASETVWTCWRRTG